MPGHRLAVGGQLLAGLVLYAASIALLVHAGQGNMPWDVLGQGVARQAGWSLGTATVVVSAAVLLCWWPLRQRPGIGTVANVVVIGVLVDPALRLLAALPPLATPVAVLMTLAGIALNGVATACYIGTRLGPGPRDGLMTGLVARTGRSVRLVRTSIEVVVVLVGVALGGRFGWGTVAYALLIGPVVHALLPWFTRPADVPTARTDLTTGTDLAAPADGAAGSDGSGTPGPPRT